MYSSLLSILADTGNPPHPFTIAVAEDVLTDLRTRIAATRWPDEPADAGWDYGANRRYLRELLEYWAARFDRTEQERRLNQLPQYRTRIDRREIHFVHARGGDGAIPLLLLHGWPMTFAQMERILPLLTGGKPSFDVVVPSLPGYGFSGRPVERGVSIGSFARSVDPLMRELGHERYAVRASDIGAGVAAALPHRSLIGVHQSGTNPFLQNVPKDLSDRERQFVADLQDWVQQEFAYAQLHATKPQTAVGREELAAEGFGKRSLHHIVKRGPGSCDCGVQSVGRVEHALRAANDLTLLVVAGER